MSAFWHDPQSERLVAAHLNGARPAWVWESESERLVWRNRAAIAYEAAHRRRTGDALVPVPRQIPRTVRMGLAFSASRSRLQFAIGRKPISETCLCTPVFLGGKLAALLVVIEAPLSEDELAGTAITPDSIAPFLGKVGPYALVAADGTVLIEGNDGAKRIADGQSPAGELATGADSRLVMFDSEPVVAVAAPEDLLEPEAQVETVSETSAAEAPAEAPQTEERLEIASETPVDEPPAAEETEPAGANAEALSPAGGALPAEVLERARREALVDLIDQLDSRQVLYQPLGEQDDGVFVPPENEEPVAEAMDVEEPLEAEEIDSTGTSDVEDETRTEVAPDEIGVEPATTEEAEVTADIETREPKEQDLETSAKSDVDMAGGPVEEAPQPDETERPPARKLWKVVGRGLSLLHGGRNEAEPEIETEVEQIASEVEASTETATDDTGHDPLSIIGAIAESASRPSASETEAPPAGTDATEPEHATEAQAPIDSDETSTDEPVESELEGVPGRIADLLGPADAEIEQTSRYNFDELSRILNDRVSGASDTGRPQPEPTDAANAGALVNLGDETLILNRLPLGLLVFRDQQILFNNRAFTDLLGYVDGTSLRRAGLPGVFPPDGDQESAGPVTKLMGADGRVLSVSARLQVISWQGRPALLLSANRHKEPLNSEDLARSFASFIANALDFGYFETSRAGILTSISGQAAILSHRRPDALISRPIHSMIALSEGARLRGFLEQPARFAGGERPSMRFEGTHPGTEIIIFAEGMAGIVTGYFGFIRAKITEAREDSGLGIDPDFLIHLARAMRQPVNAIVGFAEMIRNEAFGPIPEERYTDYGRFIHGAGRDIAGMIDELEDYARLRDEDYPLTVTRLSLIDLLASSMARVRPYAAATRVFVRSSISASLPDISADGETLAQAVLNILATAIAHSPTGGQVVLSAQKRSDGAVEVHVRDSGHSPNDSIEDSFMVFRDGEAADGEKLTPMPSAIGFALTRTLLTVNSVALDVDPDRGSGMLFSLVIPAELVVRADSFKN